MIDALLLSAALQAPTMVEDNRWQDSGHAVWDTEPRWIRDVGYCIRKHESINVGHYRADNPTSTASGAYQFLQSTWDGNAQWAKHGGRFIARQYVGRPPSSVPAGVQDVVFVHSVKQGGLRAWYGTDCPGTG